MKEFASEELAKFDGGDGRPAYVARDGKVYDVSDSKLWKGGAHMKRHRAGGDLSGSFPQAPHGEEVFEKVKQVGVMKKAPPAPAATAWADWLLGFHPHPIMVHFPQAFFAFAPLFIVLARVFENVHFERTAYYMLACGILMYFPTFATGIFHWIYKYGKSAKFVFKFKIGMSLILIAYACVVFSVHASRARSGAVAVDAVLIVLYLLLIPIIAAIGHAGGIIVFGRRK